MDPRTGGHRVRVTDEAASTDVDAVVRAAHAARSALAGRPTRAAFLRACAARLEAAGEAIVAAADAETALGETRLQGELGRTCTQLRAFADAVDAGAFLDAIINHPDPTITPPVPDLRRYKIPLGVVAVYAASNFPLAFSVPGGDTASALAAGCPVVVKAHPDHPETSEIVLTVLRRAAADCGLPDAVVSVVHGFQAGLDLIRHPLIAAAGFTGSVRGGRALFDAAAARPVPIPFHGELGSLNPVVVTRGAAADRATDIGEGLAASATLGVGQFCVKPGLVLVPSGDAGDRLVSALAGKLAAAEPGVLLDHRMRDNFLRGVAERLALPGVTAPVVAGPEGEHAVKPGLLTVSADAVASGSAHEALLEECFGPVTVIARYDDDAQIEAVLAAAPGSLTATLHVSPEEAAGQGAGGALLARLTELAGRLVVNGWPTGVAVAAAQHHGGPYPATTSTSTSVGITAIERWLRPVAYQGAPDALLPPELQESNPLRIPRLVDGKRES
ncbi:aldehyde dehydrogenase (NADP(+)) [Yinghuangia aomiensis]|uniref:aldehyde dehydrogenase (NADP(+)) n=1 Tax=Yinghuangia aomiensis TaxID=676205 RepID=UPI0031E507C2